MPISRVPTPILTNLAIMVVLLAANVNAALASAIAWVASRYC